MKKWIKVAIALLLLAGAGGFYGWYLYNKQPADIKQETATQTISSEALITAFNSDEQAATQKFTDKILAVTGKITDIQADQTGTTIFLEGNDPLAAVTCSFYESETEKVKTLKPGAIVTIKGVCTGKLTDVVLNKCSLVP